MPEELKEEQPEWKSLSKRELQIKNQQLKSVSSELHDHLGQMGQFMEKALLAHFQILRFCHNLNQQLKLAGPSLGPQKIKEIMETLEACCQMAVGFAVEWRKMQDPDFDPAGFLDMDALTSEEGLKGLDHIQAKCTACDWSGFKTDLTTELRCPMCDEMTEMVEQTKEEPDGEAKEG